MDSHLQCCCFITPNIHSDVFFPAVCCFQVDDLLLIEEKIDLEVRSLETCMFENKTFSDILNRVQKAVDDLNLHSYSNLPIWVNKLDIEVGIKKQYNYLFFLFSWILTVDFCFFFHMAGLNGFKTLLIFVLFL